MAVSLVGSKLTEGLSCQYPNKVCRCTSTWQRGASYFYPRVFDDRWIFPFRQSILAKSSLALWDDSRSLREREDLRIFAHATFVIGIDEKIVSRFRDELSSIWTTLIAREISISRNHSWLCVFCIINWKTVLYSAGTKKKN